ncbi:hypothetical protein VTK56DRAFT_3883 [Thermocarpiscus australiensis]
MLTSTAVLSLVVASASAATVQYVTDMDLYSALAPCAQSALKYVVESQTYDKCPQAVTELQSCVCTKKNDLASIASRVSASVSYSCDSTASDDQASVATVLSAYCNPDLSVAFPTPTAVSVYITDIPEVEYLAPCAKSALTYAVGTMSYDKCPSDAPALASCACSKNQNSLVVSQIINSLAKSSCSGRTVDVSSAQAMFAGYCALNNGTSNFPVPSNPPGDMTYYLTDLPQFNSLAPCAASALAYAVFSQTYDLCPEGPQALASCVCIKDGMTAEVLKSITSSVKYRCESTAIEDVNSAVSVYDYYCSAAQAKVTPAGISNSVEQTYPAGRTGSGGAKPTGGNGGGGRNGSGSGNGGSGGTGGATDDEDSNSKGPGTAVIVGAVVGAVAGLALIAVLVFFLVKHAKKREALKISDSGRHGDHPSVPLGPYGGKQELPADSVAAPAPRPSPSPSTLKANVPSRVDSVSPVSAANALTPPPNKAELQGQGVLYPPVPNAAELHGQGATTHPPPSPSAPELYGQGVPATNRPELQGQGAMYPPPPPNLSELQGQGSHFHSPNPNRPELQGQSAMYAPPPDRPELAGQYAYPQSSPQMQQQYPQPYPPQPPYPPQQMHGHHTYHPGAPAPPPGAPMYGQQQPSTMSWQAGPVPGLHEVDGGGYVQHESQPPR